MDHYLAIIILAFETKRGGRGGGIKTRWGGNFSCVLCMTAELLFETCGIGTKNTCMIITQSKATTPFWSQRQVREGGHRIFPPTRHAVFTMVTITMDFTDQAPRAGGVLSLLRAFGCWTAENASLSRTNITQTSLIVSKTYRKNMKSKVCKPETLERVTIHAATIQLHVRAGLQKKNGHMRMAQIITHRI